MGRPSLEPGRYFRLLLLGYFEGIDSERGIAWRATDSLAIRSFLRLPLDEPPPDHSTISRTRRADRPRDPPRGLHVGAATARGRAELLKGKTVAIDATTLEANAAMRSIVRRDTEESYQEFLTGLAKASGIETPTREELARLDRKRKKKTSNKDWKHPWDPDAKVAKMKDGRTHLAHKAEHAVDLETGAIVAVTLQGADQGDTTTIVETAIAAAEQIEAAQADVETPQPLEEVIADKGYHSNQTMVDLDAVGIRSYVAEPDRGRRDWSKEPEAQAPGVWQSSPDSGRARPAPDASTRRADRTLLRASLRHGRDAAHASARSREHPEAPADSCGGFNLGLVMRQLIGIGTPRGLQGRPATVIAALMVLIDSVRRPLVAISAWQPLLASVRWFTSPITIAVNFSAAATYTTGC